jgi:hypothetical protein
MNTTVIAVAVSMVVASWFAWWMTKREAKKLAAHVAEFAAFRASSGKPVQIGPTVITNADGTQADDEKDLGHVSYEARMAYLKAKGNWQRLSVAERLAEKAGAQAVLDATEPTVGIPRMEPQLCACGHFEVMHSLETPYPCQHGYVADVCDKSGKVVKRGRPSDCGCKGYTFDKPAPKSATAPS